MNFSALGEFCIVYAREFSFFSACWYTSEKDCSNAVSKARNQVEIGFNVMLWHNEFKSFDWWREWGGKSKE